MDETAFKSLISGERRGVIPALQRAGLSALSLFYGLAVRGRNRAFDVGLKTSHNVDVPVVSVGNITTGGTGKTPLVAFLVQWFQEHGVQPAILSRGYRSITPPASGGRQPAVPSDAPSLTKDRGADTPRSPGTVNDEKLVLDRLCPGVPHLQQPNRVSSAKTAIAEHAAQLLILDDGFQHRRLQRDLDIVLIDALNPFGYGRLLPRGLLREPLTGLRRADVIVLTRADQCEADTKSAIRETVRRFAPDVPFIEVAFRANGLVNSASETQPLSSLHGKSVVAFCGIGNPESFRRTLSDCDIREFRMFPDHHHYTESEVQELGQLAEQHSASLVTTLKDLVKIDPDTISERPIWAVQITAEILNGADELETCLLAVLKNRKSA